MNGETRRLRTDIWLLQSNKDSRLLDIREDIQSINQHTEVVEMDYVCVPGVDDYNRTLENRSVEGQEGILFGTDTESDSYIRLLRLTMSFVSEERSSGAPETVQKTRHKINVPKV